MLQRAWIAGARLGRRLYRRRHPIVPGDERHRRWIAEHVSGKSFVDVGGLHRVAGDVALYAEEAGASGVTLFDSGDPRFTAFIQKRDERNSNVRFVQGDLEDPESVAAIGEHDIVWSVGVIYHTPNPVQQLLHLRKLTRELLYLGTHTIPEVPGLEHACVYYPYLGDKARQTYASAHERPEGLWGIGTPFNEQPMLGHGNFWWGITPSALRAMLATARFEVVQEIATNETPFFTEIVARPMAADPLLPPVEYFREYGARREAGEEVPPFETYYDELRNRNDQR